MKAWLAFSVQPRPAWGTLREDLREVRAARRGPARQGLDGLQRDAGQGGQLGGKSLADARDDVPEEDIEASRIAQDLIEVQTAGTAELPHGSFEERDQILEPGRHVAHHAEVRELDDRAELRQARGQRGARLLRRGGKAVGQFEQAAEISQ